MMRSHARKSSRAGVAVEKIALIERTNPRWVDLSDDWEQQPKIYGRPWRAEEMI